MSAADQCTGALNHINDMSECLSLCLAPDIWGKPISQCLVKFDGDLDLRLHRLIHPHSGHLSALHFCRGWLQQVSMR